jgi:hypothetical protein
MIVVLISVKLFLGLFDMRTMQVCVGWVWGRMCGVALGDLWGVGVARLSIAAFGGLEVVLNPQASNQAAQHGCCIHCCCPPLLLFAISPAGGHCCLYG